MNLFTKTVFIITSVFVLFSSFANAANIAIVESTSFHPLQQMDSKWESLAVAAGNNVTILPQTSLDDVANLTSYDVLILSNGLIQLTPTREDVIYQFIAQGGNAYIQAEYQATQPGNEVFEYVINQLGGDFTWTGEANGNIVPMNVFGELAEGDNAITEVEHFWYGAYGSGDANITPFLEHNGKHYGFTYCSPNPAHGKIVTTSDQDWMRLGYAENLAQNIIHYLTNNNIVIPSIFVTVSNSSPCENEPITFIANVGTTPATIEYQWLVNNVEVTGATAAEYTSTFNGGDLVHCQITFSDNCTSQTVSTPALEVAIIYPLTNMPTLEITTANTTLCPAENITVYATPSNLTGFTNISFQWTLNNQSIPNATDLTLILNSLNDGDILSCNVLFDAPCSSNLQVESNEIAFTVNASTTPNLTIISDLTNICAGEAVNFFANATDAGTAPIFHWMVDGDIVGTNDATFSPTNLTDGQVVTCVVESSGLCATMTTATSNPITIAVSTPTTPEINITADQTTTCVGETVTFTTNTNITSPQFLWFIDGISTGMITNTFTPNYLTNGQTVTCQVTTSDVCVTTSSVLSNAIAIEVTSDESPTLTITSDATIVCYGGEVTFTATGDHLGTNPQYQWMIDGTITGNNTATLNTTFTNEQTISCIVTTNTNCSGALTANSNEITIAIGSLTVEVMDIQPERCDESNGLVQLEAMGGSAPYTYNWDNNPTNTNELTDLSAGDYSVVVTDVNGCSAALEITVPYNAVPEIASVEAEYNSCNEAGGSASVQMENTNVTYSYAWKNADNEIISSGIDAHNLTEGLYFIEVTDTYGCMVSEEIYIEAVTPIQVEILEKTTIELGEDYRLQVVTNRTDATFSWKADETLSCDDCMTPTVTPVNTTTYYLTVTTAEGCVATASITIQVEKPRNVFVPNAFSPNNDGNNDKFTIYGGDDVVRVKTFQVFDRWGAMIYSKENFQPNDEAHGWDGKIGNKKVSEGVFIYLAEIEFKDGRVDIYKGDVTATK